MYKNLFLEMDPNKYVVLQLNTIKENIIKTTKVILRVWTTYRYLSFALPAIIYASHVFNFRLIYYILLNYLVYIVCNAKYHC